MNRSMSNLHTTCYAIYSRIHIYCAGLYIHIALAFHILCVCVCVDRFCVLLFSRFGAASVGVLLLFFVHQIVLIKLRLGLHNENISVAPYILFYCTISIHRFFSSPMQFASDRK